MVFVIFPVVSSNVCTEISVYEAEARTPSFPF